MTDIQKSWALHLGIIALLFVLQFILPAYHHGSLARVMVLTCYHGMQYPVRLYRSSQPWPRNVLRRWHVWPVRHQHLDWTAGPALLAGTAGLPSRW